MAPSNLDQAECGLPAVDDLTIQSSQNYPVNTADGFSEYYTQKPCEVIQQANGPEICVLRYHNITIHGRLWAEGPRALALVATGDLIVDGTIDVSASKPADKISDGPGVSTVIGGAYGTPSGSGAPAWGTPELVPLIGGSRGEPIYGNQSFCPNTGLAKYGGGGGGGALQLVGCGSVNISGTINAGGGAGEGGCQFQSATAGGSGGAILVEGGTVSISGGLFSNGGGGGGGAYECDGVCYGKVEGGMGENAQASLLDASGGAAAASVCTSIPSGAGGHGGATDLPGPTGLPDPMCQATCSAPAICQNGGAGGAVGRIRINSASGMPDVMLGTFSPSPTIGTVAPGP